MNKKIFVSYVGGEQLASTELLKKETELSYMLNANHRTIGGISKDLGYDYLAKSAGVGIQVGTGAITTLYEFNKQNGTRILLAVLDNGSTVKIRSSADGGATWTDRLTGWTTGKQVNFATYLDYVFATNGQDNPQSWDGATSSFGSTNLSGAPVGGLIDVVKFRLVIISSTRIYYSSLPVSNAITWDTANFYVDLPTDQGDTFQAINDNASRNLIFKNNTIFKFDIQDDLQTSAPYVSRTEGLSAARSVAAVGNYTSFFYDGQIWTTTGGDPFYFSQRIQPLLDTIPISNWSKLVAQKFQNLYRLFISNVTYLGKILNNAFVEFDTNLNYWKHGTYNDNFTSFCTAVINNKRVMLGGTDNGYVMQMDTGWSQAGKAYPFEVEFPTFYGSGPDDFDTFQTLHIDGYNLGGLTFTIQYDNGDIEELGQVPAEESNHTWFGLGTKNARNAKVRCSSNSTQEGPLIQELSFEFDSNGKSNRQR